MASLRPVWLPLALLGPLALSCASPTPNRGPTPNAEAPAVDAVEARVLALMARARAEEPSVTARLKALAVARGGKLVKLEHRLKTKGSAIRKLTLKLHEQPDLRPADITLKDMLRYTMVVDDAPAGNYVRAVRQTLATLEAEGHEVELIKNYWPPDDNYSGVNSVLHCPTGLPWELQFHTPASLEVQSATRDQYEELRDEQTPIDRRRTLFDTMTAAWNAVPIPDEVLREKNLHSGEQIRTRARP